VVVFPPQIIPQGEGAFIVKPGRPISTLTPKQLADQIGVNRQSIYRWLAEGTLPEALTQRAGKRKILFSAAAVEVMKRYFAARADSDADAGAAQDRSRGPRQISARHGCRQGGGAKC
jgi:excisionase family DNA binding protein